MKIIGQLQRNSDIITKNNLDHLFPNITKQSQTPGIQTNERMSGTTKS